MNKFLRDCLTNFKFVYWENQICCCLIIHNKNKQRVYFDSIDNSIKMMRSKKLRQITLTKYFIMNFIVKQIEKTNRDFRIDYNDVDKNFKNYLY